MLSKSFYFGKIRNKKVVAAIAQKLTPTRNLPMMRIWIVGARPMIKEPKINRVSAKIIVGFLPKLSERGPPIIDPKAAPSYAIDTIVCIK